MKDLKEGAYYVSTVNGMTRKLNSVGPCMTYTMLKANGSLDYWNTPVNSKTWERWVKRNKCKAFPAGTPQDQVVEAAKKYRAAHSKANPKRSSKDLDKLQKPGYYLSRKTGQIREAVVDDRRYSDLLYFFDVDESGRKGRGGSENLAKDLTRSAWVSWVDRHNCQFFSPDTNRAEVLKAAGRIKNKVNKK